MTDDTIQLEGTREQSQELLRAVEIAKTVLFQLGGDSKPMDAVIEKRLSKLSYWSETLEGKLR